MNRDESRRKSSSYRKKIKKIKKILLFIIFLESIAVVCLGIIFATGNQPQENGETQSQSIIKSIAESTELVQGAKKLKNDFKVLAEALKEQNQIQSLEMRETVRQDISDLRTVMNKPIWKTAAILPVVDTELQTARELLQICEDADQRIIGPYIDLMTAYPLSEMKTDNGIRVDLVVQYLDFVEKILPEAEDFLYRIKQQDLSLIDRERKIEKYLAEGEQLLSYADYLPPIRAILGDGRDRLFVFAAQNTSEMRSSGGFPGAISSIEIKNGLLKITDFIEVRAAFVQDTPAEAQVTNDENRIFLNRMKVTWDADFNPNYERVASIWAMAYELKNGVEVDGVISATPTIIQKLLSFLGSVTLSDGTVLDGENATRVLGHDLYFKYLGSEQMENAAKIVDGLFSECAKKTFELMLSSFSVSQAKDYISFFKDCVNDRSIMIWLADENEQELIREAGWNAGLNVDPQKPEIGIFFSSAVDSKMTWYLDIDYNLSDPIVNADGSRTYELTVILSSNITEQERALASGYILGWTEGITGVIYVFGPAGGTATDFQTNIDRYMLTTNYNDLDLGFMVVDVHDDEPFIVSCRITTAPGVETPIKVIMPPTMSEYN